MGSGAGPDPGRDVVTSGERKGSFGGMEEWGTFLFATDFCPASTRGNSHSPVFLLPVVQPQSMKSNPAPAIASLILLFMGKESREAAQNPISIATGFLDCSRPVEVTEPAHNIGKNPFPLMIIKEQVIALRIVVTLYPCAR